MKKQLILFVSLLIAVSSVGAQKPDTASAMVHYKFSHLRDTTKPQDIYTESMILLLGKNATAFKSYDRILAEMQAKKQVQEQVAANGGNGPIKITMKKAGSGTEYYLFATEKKFIRKEKLINNYLVDEPVPVINWQISSDTATFGGFHCQKATTHFKGRNYTAWFCPDIPVHSGPWKLSGLPGLILEAYDAKKEVVFKFDGFEDMSKTVSAAATKTDVPQQSEGGVVKLIGVDADTDPILIMLPADAIKTTAAEFTKLKEAMRKDPNAFMQSAMAGSGANMNVNGPKTNMHIIMTSPVENNPVELPEKK
jgi:GLPGLI family protein